MAYVYDRVAKDQFSRQTPHYGFVDGDGDLIFNTPIEGLSQDPQKERDVPISVPPMLQDQPAEGHQEHFVGTIKEYLSEPRHRIRLNDLATKEMRRFLSEAGIDRFPVQSGLAGSESFVDRLKRYEILVQRLQVMAVLLGRWATADQRNVLARLLSRSCEIDQMQSGLIHLLGLRFYPATILLYSAGIAALSENNYDNLYAVMTASAGAGTMVETPRQAVTLSAKGMFDVDRSNAFKTVPGHDRNHVPRSEYLLTALQPVLEDVLFLGASYEQLFDRFELFLALVNADLSSRDGHVRGPFGRFAWKYHGRHDENPFIELKKEVKQKQAWPPLLSGFFGGSYDRICSLVDSMEAVLQRLGWH